MKIITYNNTYQKNHWNGLAKEKEFPTPFEMDEFENKVTKEINILDVGCGYGRILNELYRNGFKNLTGVDFSEEMIKRGLKLYPHLNLIKNNGDDLPFPDNEFDAVILVGVLTSNITNKEQENLIKEISRVLKKNGVFYVSDFLLNNDERNLKRYAKYKDEYGIYGVFKLPEGLVLRHHTSKHILKLTRKFNTILFKKTVYETMNGNRSNGFYYIGKKE